MAFFKAIRIHEHGGLEKLQVNKLPLQPLKSDEVRVKIHASALNRLDIWVRAGLPGWNLPLPLIPGSDGAGEIVEIGNNVRSIALGDKVVIQPAFGCGDCQFCKHGDEHYCLKFGIRGENTDGTHTEIIQVTENQVVKFENLNWAEAAAIPLTFVTAWEMIEKAQLQKGETVLIWAASSGVSTAAIQIAKWKGARVIATAGSKEKLKFAKSLGADAMIHHYEEDVSKRIKELTNNCGVNLVIDHVGEKTIPVSFRCLAWGGRIVTCGSTTGTKAEINLRHLFFKQLSIIGSTMGRPDSLPKIIKLADDGVFRGIVSQKFPFSGIAKAHETMEKSQQLGKLILTF